MPIKSLDHQELVEFDALHGSIHFLNQRVLLVDAMALGILRKSMIENLGADSTQALLCQHGFAHGWHIATAMRETFPKMSVPDLVSALPHVHGIAGFFRSRPKSNNPMDKKGAIMTSSFEADQHLVHVGRSAEPVCWTICGLLGGYLSQVTGERQYVLEDQCVAAGHAACHFSARTREEWGAERQSELSVFDSERVRETLAIKFNRVRDSVDAADKKSETRRSTPPDRPKAGSRAELGAKSKAIQKACELAVRVAAVDATVLITGESGVGKERIARLIHDESPRSGGPFIAVNCGAITESLLESELFGHKRGAFTGASSDRIGLFEAASHGTILLDEIGEVSMGMQVKLLRVLQEHEIRRVGESKGVSIDVRVLAATNRDLLRCVEEETFRRDLYYRLNVVEVAVPPLRDRKVDIVPLCRVFLEDAAKRMGRDVLHLSPEAADRLTRHDWPGNVRELENAIERAAALASGPRVEESDLPSEVRGRRSTSPPPTVISDGQLSLGELEKRHIFAALESNDGNQAKTARQLKIGTATLYRKLRKYGEEDAAAAPTRGNNGA